MVCCTPAECASQTSSDVENATTIAYKPGLLTRPPTPCPPQDEDPYVRKTAAVCVAKLYDINAELVEDRGFLDMLKVGRGGRGGDCVGWMAGSAG